MNVYQASDLRLLAEAFSEGTGITLAVLGQRMGLNDKIFPRLVNGSGCTLASAETASAWFNENWPDKLRWPLRKKAAA